MNNKPKLIIWDFDGVISDSEKIWLENRRTILNQKYGANWDFETANKYIGGISDKTKIGVLKNLGIIVDENFEKECLALDYTVMEKSMVPTPGVIDLFESIKIKQCIATGGIRSKTLKKIEIVNIGKYFNDDNLFTADMVEHGKPEPELFLLAAEKMGEKPQDCIVIEDSIAGMTAGLRANMHVVAYLGCDMYESSDYRQKVEKMGIKDIFYNMEDLKKFLLKKII